jgi:flagellum-specific ATP synthase
VRAVLDGHIVLSRRLTQARHYPAIDVLQSVSRLMPDVTGPATRKAINTVIRQMAAYADAEDLINVGAYHAGSNPAIDEAIANHGAIEEFLVQDVDEKAPMEETLRRLAALSGIEIPDGEISLQS